MQIPDMTVLALECERISSHWAITKRAQDKLTDELLRAYRARFPKRRTPSVRKAQDALPEFAQARFEHYKAALQRAYRLRDRRAERLGRVLDWMATRRRPVATPDPLVYSESAYSTYRSQGWSCESYTRQAAEQDAAHCQMLGVRAEIVDWTYTDPAKPEPYKFGYRVMVYTDRAGIEILQRKPVSIKVWLQDCWNRGVNPRVYNPFLPHDLEERMGVSFCPRPVAS